VTASATKNQATLEENNSSKLPGGFVPIAMAVAIVPGPVVDGMVSGKKAIFCIAVKLAADVACVSWLGGGAWSISQIDLMI